MKYFLITLLLLLTSMAATAQTADDIIAKHLAARGGAALDQIKTAEMEIALSFKNAPQMKATMTTRTVNLQSHRVDMALPGVYETVICFESNSGWTTIKRGEAIQLALMDSLEVKDLKFQTEIMGPLHRYKEKGYQATYLGLDTVQETEVFKIRIDAINQTTYFSYIETTHYSEIKRTTIEPSGGEMITVDLYYSEIRPVLGVSMPHHVEMHNRRGITYIDHTRIVLNGEIDPTLFKTPDDPRK